MFLFVKSDYTVRDSSCCQSPFVPSRTSSGAVDILSYPCRSLSPSASTQDKVFRDPQPQQPPVAVQRENPFGILRKKTPIHRKSGSSGVATVLASSVASSPPYIC